MVIEIKSHEWLLKATDNAATLVETLRQVDSICQHCEPASPMVCAERCEIWKAKNELLEMNGTLCADNYFRGLLNAVKNDRRREVIDALSEWPHSIEDLQEYLRDKGYYHSRRTIANSYVEPLLESGLVRKDSNKYRLTLYGRKFRDVLSKFDVEDSLPSHSRCYEEILLRKLKHGPKTYEDLVGPVPQNTLSRTIQRLMEEGLVIKTKSSDYVFYFRTKKAPKKKFSPTEKKIYEAIPEAGASARELSKEVGINLRRTYKYVRRLRKRRLVFRREKPRTYELTSSGGEVADFLEEMANLVSDASKASASLLERSRQTMAAPYLKNGGFAEEAEGKYRLSKNGEIVAQ
jgi:predicted transcriptional regulator